MEELSFGEQVKIILSRKNMTIKELAEMIQEETGKPMSRQNLTQRLGRDNFQEKDMRMIASILDCPFRLSIFPTSPEEDEKIMEYAHVTAVKKRAKHKKEEDADVYQQTLVFDGEPVIPQEAPKVEERDITIGELYDIHEELDEIEEAVEAEKEAAEAAEKEAVAESVEGTVVEEQDEAPVEVVEEVSGEVLEAEPELSVEMEEAEEYVEDPVVFSEETETEETVVAEEPVDVYEEATEEAAVEEAEPVVEAEPVEEPAKPEKKEKLHSGGIFLRRMRRGNEDVKKPEVKKEEEKPVEKKTRPVITPDSADFEPVVKHEDVEEDLSVGEMNPYTGREYQTNSVRMHPTRIGYVQVYDRSQHQWTDMTEWAFLGYQERKKALLGKDYEPPIYLD